MNNPYLGLFIDCLYLAFITIFLFTTDGLMNCCLSLNSLITPVFSNFFLYFLSALSIVSFSLRFINSISIKRTAKLKLILNNRPTILKFDEKLQFFVFQRSLPLLYKALNPCKTSLPGNLWYNHSLRKSVQPLCLISQQLLKRNI